MKRLLLLLGAAALLVAAPAMAQYISLDVNNDGICDANDVLTPSVTSVDVYFDTNHNKDGSTAVCSTGEDLTISSYGVILTASGAGSVTYGTWTDHMAATVPGGFNIKIADARGGSDIFVAYGGATQGAPGKYKVGTLAVTVTGNPVLDWNTSSSVDVGAVTVFGTLCLGSRFDGSQIYGTDFFDHCGTNPFTPNRPTTWGAIKNLYK